MRKRAAAASMACCDACTHVRWLGVTKSHIKNEGAPGTKRATAPARTVIRHVCPESSRTPRTATRTPAKHGARTCRHQRQWRSRGHTPPAGQNSNGNNRKACQASACAASQVVARSAIDYAEGIPGRVVPGDRSLHEVADSSDATY
ncbi:hypothetical protein EON66_11710, partial [archaeon]